MKAIHKTANISNACVACGCCVKVCPKKALSVHKGLFAKTDESKCVGCGLCANACPADVIEMVEMLEMEVASV